MTSFSARTPNEPYIPVTQFSSIFCYKFGYPNHRARHCTRRGPPPQRGTSFPFNQQKKLNKPLFRQKPKENQNIISSYDQQNVLELININPKQAQMLPYVKLKLLPLISRRALIDTGACANVISENQCAELKKESNVKVQQCDTTPKWFKAKLARGQLMQVKHEIEMNLNGHIKHLKKNFWYLKHQFQYYLEIFFS